MKLKKKYEFVYEIEKEKDMNVPAKIIANEKLLEKMQEDKTLEQAKNITKLPGVLDKVIVLSDAHQGFGFPIGGVAVFDSKKGIITPAGIGYDINCGIRILKTNLGKKDILKRKKQILEAIFEKIPSGVGRGGKFQISKKEFKILLEKGAKYLIEKSYGYKDDLNNIEENGNIKNADSSKISEKAIKRGLGQLGTLGAGNHFLEISYIKEIFDKKTAKVFGLKKDQAVIMIHCGSRGLGHQIISDYIKKMELNKINNLPDKELIYAPINSELGKDCFQAMNCGVNYAFANRQLITHLLREVFNKIDSKIKIDVLYDVCHNIAKIEKHIINGKEKQVLIHRKGATRSFGPGRKEIPEKYRKVGQPVLIPGSMGTCSYVLVGTKKAEEISFGSTVHGAGRAESRTSASKKFDYKSVKNELYSQGIDIKTRENKTLLVEAPKAYKDVNEVVKVVDKLGISKKVAKLKPILVLK